MENPVDLKSRLLHASIQLFAERGYAGTSIRDIATEMGISVSSIYNYYESKETVLLAILKYATNMLLAYISTVYELDIDPAQKIRLMVNKHIQFIQDRPHESRVYIFDVSTLSGEVTAYSRSVQKGILSMYVDVLKQLDEAGLLNAKNHTVAAFHIFGVVNWYLRWRQDGGPLSDEEVGESIAAFVLNGLLGEITLHGAVNVQ